MSVLIPRVTLCWKLHVVALQAAVLVGMTPTPGLAAEAKPATASSMSSDAPFVIMALSSVDRLRERTTHLAQATGQPENAETLFQRISAGLGELLVLDGLDPSRPIGLLAYPQFIQEANLDDVSGEAQRSTSATNLTRLLDFDGVQRLLANEPVIFFPVADAGRFVSALAALAGEQFLPVPGKPGYFQNEQGQAQPVRRVGKYVLYCTDQVASRDFPDLDKLLRPLLANRDVVVSIQARGIPAALRRAVGDGMQSVADAASQRFDDETDVAFRWRTALGAFQREILNLIILHIDEINFGVHLDTERSETTFDLEVVGPKDGKLAKLCHGLPGKRSLFAGLANEEGPVSLALLCSLSPRLTKPLAAALRTRPEFGLDWCASDVAIASLGEVFSTLANTVEAGQLDALLTTRGRADDRGGLLGLRVAGSSRFVDAVQQILEQHRQSFETIAKRTIGTDGEPTYVAEERPYHLMADKHDDRPIHRVPVVVLHELLARWNDYCPLPLPRTGSLWIAATPQSLWFAWSNDEFGTSAPESLKEAMQSLARYPTPGSASSRSAAPIQLTLHVRDWASAGEPRTNLASKRDAVSQTTLQPSDHRLRENEITPSVFRDRADALRCDVQPTARGLRVRVVLEEAYAAWFSLILTGNSEEESSGNESISN